MSLQHVGAQGMLASGVPAKHVLDAVRGTSMMADPAHLSTAQAGSGEKVPRTVRQGTPNINEPHEVHPGVIPARRWEDLSDLEQKDTLKHVAMHGSSPDKMQSDLRDQVLSAHARAGRNATAAPYSSHFYEGPSLPHSKIEEGADEAMQHGFTDRQTARIAVATANSDTSPNVKFQQGQRFPNHEAAMHAVRHVMAGGSVDRPPTPGEMGIAAYPANMQKAAYHVSQIAAGKSVRELTGPTSKFSPEGAKGFDPSNAPKTTDYLGAWNDPTGPDSRYVSDVHSTHSLMPHLGTAKPVVHQLKNGSTKAILPGDKVPQGAVPMTTSKGKVKTSKSETENYLAQEPVGLSALHDHIARKVAVDLGLSHSVHNAGATHFLQATDWGEEQVLRKDITDRTEKTAYSRDERDPLRVPAGNERVSQGTEPTQAHFYTHTPYTPPSQQRSAAAVSNRTMSAASAAAEPDVAGKDRDKLERGVAARSAAITKKRGVKLAGDEHFGDEDPWAPRNQR
jgi:nucleoid-associated protein YgaU